MPHNITEYKGEYAEVFKKIDPSDLKFNPYQVHKTFNILSSSAVTDEYAPLEAVYVSNLPALSSSLEFNDAKNVDGSYKFNIYNSVNHLFYAYKKQPDKAYGYIDLNNASRFLYESASVISIPQKKMGERIKPDSFTYINNNSISLASDRYGNIYDVDIDTGSFAGEETFYEGFNEYFDLTRIQQYEDVLYWPEWDSNSSIIPWFSTNVTYVNGVSTTDGSQLPIGLAARFGVSSSISTKLNGNYDRDNDYAISFFITGGNSTNSNELIIGKALAPRDFIIQVVNSGTAGQINSSMLNQMLQYPFAIELSGSNQIIYSISAGTQYPFSITSSAEVSSSWNHVLCQKSGSEMQMYINSTLHSSQSFSGIIPTTFGSSSVGNIDNQFPLKIGGYYPGYGCLQGDLDEIRIFNKALTQAQITSLSDHSEGGGMLQTNRVGNLFYSNGFAVISSPDYRYENIINMPYTASYKSTITTYEMSSLCRIDSGEFNLTTNPTTTLDNNYTYKSYVTGSSFQPYITTIGLYNELGQLLAIGKLANAIRKRDDIDMNIHVSLDLDKNKSIKFVSGSVI
jgi:hypothetical protein